MFQERVHFALLHLWKQATNPRDGANRCLLQAPTFSNAILHHDFNQGGDFYRRLYSQRSQPHNLTVYPQWVYAFSKCQHACLHLHTWSQLKANGRQQCWTDGCGGRLLAALCQRCRLFALPLPVASYLPQSSGPCCSPAGCGRFSVPTPLTRRTRKDSGSCSYHLT